MKDNLIIVDFKSNKLSKEKTLKTLFSALAKKFKLKSKKNKNSKVIIYESYKRVL